MESEMIDIGRAALLLAAQASATVWLVRVMRGECSGLLARYSKVGGLRFLRIGKLQMSFCISHKD